MYHHYSSLHGAQGLGHSTSCAHRGSTSLLCGSQMQAVGLSVHAAGHWPPQVMLREPDDGGRLKSTGGMQEQTADTPALPLAAALVPLAAGSSLTSAAAGFAPAFVPVMMNSLRGTMMLRWHTIPPVARAGGQLRLDRSSASL